jgi:hypothetical protein
MNIFCCPSVLRDQTIALQLGFEVGDIPEFGFRARIPRDDKRLDRTEIDVKLGTLLVESRTTERDRLPEATPGPRGILSRFH